MDLEEMFTIPNVYSQRLKRMYEMTTLGRLSVVVEVCCFHSQCPRQHRLYIPAEYWTDTHTRNTYRLIFSDSIIYGMVTTGIYIATQLLKYQS